MGGIYLEMDENGIIQSNITQLTEENLTDRDIRLKTEAGIKGMAVWLDGNQAGIRYEHPVQLYRGIGFLLEWLKAGQMRNRHQETPVFEHLTYMADCSRNAVLNVDFVKRLIRQLALMGFDRLMLYTEDTFEISEYAYFGYMRGRYGKAEIKELDAYAAGYGIELVPCIQTLAHMNTLFRWKQFEGIRDTGDILCSRLEETYELIEAMVKTWSETCRSRLINIGMDEAEMIGRGNYLKHFGYEERFDIMERHLKRVLDICKKYGYTCMMWSDMFFKMLTGGAYHDKDLVISEAVRNRIPEDVELIYWDYYARNEEKYRRMITQHKQLAEQVGFAGGAWKWNGYAPLINHSMEASGYALKACEENGIQNVIVTGWGDGGAEASSAVVLPVLSRYAEYCHGKITDQDAIAKRFQACTGGILEDFLMLDDLNLTPDNPAPGRVSVGPAKYLLYQDILLGLYDRHVDGQSYPGHFEQCALKLSQAQNKEGPYSYVFATLAVLAKVLALKSDMGIRLKQGYDKRDVKELGRIREQCQELTGLLEDFQEKVRFQWLKENKVYGLEVLDIRFGGLKERTRICGQRIGDLLEGRVKRLEELEQERLLLDEKENPGYDTLPLGDNEWAKIVTAGVI